MEALGPMIGSIGIMMVFAWMLKLGLDHRRRVQLMHHQYDLQTKLLEKFSSTEEMMTYLQGDAGERFLASATAEKADPRGKILGSIQTGLVLLAGGTAFMFLRHQIAEAEEGFVLIEIEEEAPRPMGEVLMYEDAYEEDFVIIDLEEFASIRPLGLEPTIADEIDIEPMEIDF